MCMCVYAQACLKNKDDFWCFLHFSPLYLLREGLFLKLKVTDLAGLASQYACWAFMCVLGVQTLVPTLVHKVIYPLSYLSM